MNHNVVGSDASRKQVGADYDRADDRLPRFRCIGDEGCPDGEELAKLERKLVVCKVQFDLYPIYQLEGLSGEERKQTVIAA